MNSLSLPSLYCTLKNVAKSSGGGGGVLYVIIVVAVLGAIAVGGYYVYAKQTGKLLFGKSKLFHASSNAMAKLSALLKTRSSL